MRNSRWTRPALAAACAVTVGALVSGIAPVSLAATPSAQPAPVAGVTAAPSRAEAPSPRPRVVEPLAARPVAAKPATRPLAAKAAVKKKPAAKKPVTKQRPAAKKPAASRASAARAMGCDASRGWQQRRGQYVLRHLRYDYRKLGYTMVFKPARKGITGMTYLGPQRIEIYVRPCKVWSNVRMAETVAHEIGHAIDFARGTAAWHRQWQLARGIPLSVPWYGTAYAADFATPAGDFAESFAAWQVPNGPNASRWGRPSKAQLKVLIPLMQI